MPMVRAMRMLNAIEAGTLTGTQLETLLTADPGRLAELNVLLGMRGQARRMAASSTAMAAVIASSTAMAAVIASSTAMAAVAASSTAMAAVIASSTAMAAVAASSTAKTAIYNSDTALTAIGTSMTAMDALWNAASANTAATASVVLTTATAFTTLAPASAKQYLALGTMTNDGSLSAVHTIATRRSGSAIADALSTDASNVSSIGFKRFAAPVPIANPMTIQTNDISTQIISVRLINCSDNTSYT